MAMPATSPSVSPESEDSSCCTLRVVMVGSVSTVIPSEVVMAVAVVPRAEESDACTAAAVVAAGTAMVA
eukprot:scaffold9499_cov55-Phaeocystis_antarctica.AAC.1